MVRGKGYGAMPKRPTVEATPPVLAAYAACKAIYAGPCACEQQKAEPCVNMRDAVRVVAAELKAPSS